MIMMMMVGCGGVIRRHHRAASGHGRVANLRHLLPQSTRRTILGDGLLFSTTVSTNYPINSDSVPSAALVHIFRCDRFSLH